MKLLIKGPQVYTEHGVVTDAVVMIHDEIIQDIFKTNEKNNAEVDQVYTFPAGYHLMPGFIDLHVHGANGQDVMDAAPEALTILSKTLAAEGTTSFLATTMTAKADEIENVLKVVFQFMSTQQEGAAILGIHLEGPFISPAKVGAQRIDQVLPPDRELFKRWQKAAGDTIKLVTLAPELSNSIEFIGFLRRKGIIAAIGHTDATHAETVAAIAAGANYTTHLFNAMRGIHQREPGPVLAALLAEDVLTELIVDGEHLHPAIVKLILKLKTKDKMILVTDAMRAKCLGDGIYDLGGQEVAVKSGVARLEQGALAGSTLKMPAALQNMLRFTGCALADAVKMVSENPAKALGIFHRKGSIALKKDADLVVLDEKLSVVMTVCEGRVVYSKQKVGVS